MQVLCFVCYGYYYSVLNAMMVWFPADYYYTLLLNQSFSLSATPTTHFFFSRLNATSFVIFSDITPVMWQTVLFCERYKAVVVLLYLHYSYHTLWATQGRPSGTCSPQWTGRHTEICIPHSFFFRTASVSNAWQLLSTNCQKKSREREYWSGEKERGQGC